MNFLLNLLLLIWNLPWWGSLAVIAGLVASFYLAGWYFKWKFDKLVHETVLNMGAALKDAQATVHAITPVPAPVGPSPYDSVEGDDDFVENLDGEPWDEEDACFYKIDATIEPTNPEAKWDPTALALVPADFAPQDPTDVCDRLGCLHSAEIQVNGRFQPLPEGEVEGSQCLRMLFAVPEGVREVKFAKGVTYFGHVELPPPLPRRPDSVHAR
jgi:hypothetical protein